MPDRTGNLICLDSNRNPDDMGKRVVRAFHDSRRCVAPDLDHSWVGAHEEANFRAPNRSLEAAKNNGFVRVNDATTAARTITSRRRPRPRVERARPTGSRPGSARIFPIRR